MRTSHSFFTSLFFPLILALALSPSWLSSASAQPPPAPPPSPPSHTPDDLFHGWSVVDFAFDPNSDVMYVIDDGWQVVAVNTTTGRSIHSTSFAPNDVSLLHLAVDSTSQVYVTASRRQGLLLLQLDSALRGVGNVSLSTLTPPSRATQLVIDSMDYVYLFIGARRGRTDAISTRVWVMERHTLKQADTWEAKLPTFTAGTVNDTTYLIAIDSTDTLYFQQVQAQRQTFLLTPGGDPVQSFDLYSSRPRPTDDSQLITDLAIDSNQVMHFVERGSALIERFDQTGRSLTPLAVLSESPTHSSVRFDGPQLAINPFTHLLHVSDPVESSIAVVGQDGGIRRAYHSPSGQATFNDGALSVDPRTGDLIVSSDIGTLAQRVSAHDGSLLQEYTLPARLRDANCRPRSVEVGQRQGLIYSYLMCDGGVIHVQYPSGRVHSEFHVGRSIDGQVELMRVDEWGQRIYIVTYLRYEGRYQDVVRVMDMQGRLIHNITGPSAPFLSITDIVMAPTPDGGGEVIVLDYNNHRLVGVYNNGSTSFIQPYSTDMSVVDMEFADHASVYLSVLEFAFINGSYDMSSSIIQLDRHNNVTNRFVGWSREWDGVYFSSITSTNDGLFGYDNSHHAVTVWRHHTHQRHQIKMDEQQHQQQQQHQQGMVE
jgi:hypothetical protein